MKKEKNKRIRRRGHGFFKGFLKIFIRKPRYIYIGEKITTPSIILSNHVGKKAPLAYECYPPVPFRFWGTHEMNEGLGSVYKYLSEVFYHEKQHWNLFLARLFCIIAAPLTNMFYRGLNLISTYKDYRFKNTIQESVKTIQEGTSIIIFPEDSSEGYFDNLKAFWGGFVVLAHTCYKKGIDVPICVTYYRKKDKTVIVDKPMKFSELIKDGFDRNKIAELLCNRANEIKDYKAQ